MKIAFLGDIVLNEKVKICDDIIEKINTSDFVLANLEGPIIDKSGKYKTKKYGSLLSNNENTINHILNQINISHISLYNNHTYDFGLKGLLNTVEFCNKNNIKILKPFNTLVKDSEIVRLVNTGLPEYFGISAQSSNYGINCNELLFTKNLKHEIKDSIVLGHFGIEMINSLSKYELNWFENISGMRPKIIIRHHPHCVQNSFVINEVKCYPSIGDFAFLHGKKKISTGLIVIYDSNTNKVDEFTIQLRENVLKIVENTEMDIKLSLNDADKKLMRERLIREYREGGYYTFKKFVKKILGRENIKSSIYGSSTDFIQPFIIGEIFEENTDYSK